VLELTSGESQAVTFVPADAAEAEFTIRDLYSCQTAD
jgi:hypothetical protein